MPGVLFINTYIMIKIPRMSYQSLHVLKLFLDAYYQDIELTGADATRNTRIPSGTIYPMLIRFKNAKLLSSRWESGKPQELGRPKKRLYRLTVLGLAFARIELRQFTMRSEI